MSSKFRIRHSFLIPATVFAAGILIGFQTITLERLKLILIQDPDVRTFHLELGDRVIWIIEHLRPVDWMLIALGIVFFLWLVLREVRGRRLSDELGNILESEKATLILLGVLAAATGRFYLAPGQIVLGDAPCHISRVWAAAESLAGGQWPSWTFFNYAGYPLLQFYGPLFFILAGLMSNLLGSVTWATKVFLFFLHFGSAYPIYWWARATGASRHAAMIGGFAYVLSFQHTHTIVWTGALPVALVYIFFPLLLLAAEKVFSSTSGFWVLVLSASSAGLILCHHGYAAFGLQFAVLYACIRWILPGPARIHFTYILRMALGVGGGILLCSGFLWPLLAEGKWIYQSNALPLIKPGLPTIDFFKKIFIWRNLWSGWTVIYMGLSLLGFAAVGGILAWKRAGSKEDGIHRAVVLVAVFALFCAAGNGRIANLALAFIALLGGGITRLGVKITPQRYSLIILAILILDLGPTTVQSPFRTDRNHLQEGLRRAALLIEPHRALVGYFSGSRTHFFHWGSNEDTGLILPTGFFPQGAPRSLNSINAMVDALNIHGDTLSSAQIDYLYLWDIEGLIVHTRSRFVEPKLAEAKIDNSDPPVAWVRPASPLIFSQRLAVAVDDTLENLQERELVLHRDHTDPFRQAYLRRMAQWVKGMSIDRDLCRASTIFIARGEEERLLHTPWKLPGEPLPHISEPLEEIHGNITKGGDYDEVGTREDSKTLHVSNYTVNLRHVSITYQAANSGYLRVAFSWYPALRVLMDGEPVVPLRSLLGALVIPTEHGEHTVELIPYHTRIRILSILLGIVLGGLFIFLALKYAKSER